MPDPVVDGSVKLTETGTLPATEDELEDDPPPLFVVVPLTAPFELDGTALLPPPPPHPAMARTAANSRDRRTLELITSLMSSG